ncbi:SDR family NAD(P)-dependent oxidoreductase [Devosia psychrophila]|uniref:3-oxoacyl-[acyl-carrier protein] reductase n=1 Tax=Devosia psychrophila TaxID=728005 RepID=A0A0F5PV18_9HYPH|nr:SDR family NAD(P)-dependent oxidoreductase [Devosia psychrophila]KKC32241.1 short-chain dehydrogenase [Devosia psychrophila]SFD33525.1 3-oxoacyl-[acyl-carrier protein] reductase [Devosia psychrophila]
MGTARFDFTGQVVLVTGASGGLGQAIARAFAAAGAKVGVHYHANRAGAEALASEIGGIALQADLTREAACIGLVESVRSGLGGLDVIINNAGQQSVAGLTDISGDDFRAMMDANVGGPFALTKALAKAGHGGCVVNIASIEALQPATGHSHYATSKAALVMFTRAAALELGPLGIRVNAISPGLIERDGLETAWPEGVARWHASAPLQRLGKPQDVADAALFLASDAARWVTGANLVVDGGVSCTTTW